jgi:hypothetical protein
VTLLDDRTKPVTVADAGKFLSSAVKFRVTLPVMVPLAVMLCGGPKVKIPKPEDSVRKLSLGLSGCNLVLKQRQVIFQNGEHL